MFKQLFIENYLYLSSNKTRFYYNIDGGQANFFENEGKISTTFDKTNLESLIAVDKFSNRHTYKTFITDYLTQLLSRYSYNIQFFIYSKIEYITIEDDSSILKTDFRETSYIRIILIDSEGSFYRDYPLNIIDNQEIESILNKLIKFRKFKINLKKIVISKKNMPVVFRPMLGGYFIHEVLGHLLEFDNLDLRNKSFGNSNEYFLGAMIGPKTLSVYDDPYENKNLFGLNKFDDVGNVLKKIELMNNGKIVGMLGNNNLEKNQFSSCQRKQNYRFKALPRMRGTKIASGLNKSFIEIVSQYNESIVIDSILGGGVNPLSGDFQLIVSGIFFEKGIAKYQLPSLMIYGKVSESLKQVECIGSDIESAHAHCGKKGQFIDVLVGSPTISLNSQSVQQL